MAIMEPTLLIGMFRTFSVAVWVLIGFIVSGLIFIQIIMCRLRSKPNPNPSELKKLNQSARSVQDAWDLEIDDAIMSQSKYLSHEYGRIPQTNLSYQTKKNGTIFVTFSDELDLTSFESYEMDLEYQLNHSVNFDAIEIA